MVVFKGNWGGDAVRDRILDSVREQILKNGFKGFTIDAICMDLKASKKTIYKHFSSKDQMISAIIDAHIENDRLITLKALEEGNSLFDKLKSAILCYYNYSIPLKLVDELKSLFPQEWSKVEELFRFKQELFRKLISQGINEGCIKSDINIDMLMLVIQKTIPAIFDYKFLVSHDMNKATANHMLEEFCRLVFYGISK